MGLSCGCNHEREVSSKELSIVPQFAIQNLYKVSSRNEKLEISPEAATKCRPEPRVNTSRLYRCHSECPNNRDSYGREWDASKYFSFRQHPEQDQISTSSNDSVKMVSKRTSNNFVNIEPIGVCMDSNSGGTNELSDISESNVSKEITPVVSKFMTNADDEVRDTEQKLMMKGFVIPATNSDARNARKAKRTRLLTSPKQVKESSPELTTVSVPSKRKHQSSLSEMMQNVFVNSTTDICFPSYSDTENEKYSWETAEYSAEKLNVIAQNSKLTSEQTSELEESEVLEFSKRQFEKCQYESKLVSEMLENLQPLERTLRTISDASRRNSISVPLHKQNSFLSQLSQAEEIIMRGSENEIPEEELVLITKDIDELEKSINDRRARISHLRQKSLSLLTAELPDFMMDYNSDSDDDTSTFLKLEKDINQLEGEKNEFERKRRQAVSRLQNKMWGNIKAWDNQEVRPITAMPILSKYSDNFPVVNKSRSASNTFVWPACENNKRWSFSITDSSEVEKSSTHIEEFWRSQLENLNEEK